MEEEGRREDEEEAIRLQQLRLRGRRADTFRRRQQLLLCVRSKPHFRVDFGSVEGRKICFHRSKRQRRRSEGPATAPAVVDVADEEDNYARLAAKLRRTIASKKREELEKLVNCPPKMKRVLMRQLLEEHHAAVSRQLAQLRFNNGVAVLTERTLREIAVLEDQTRDLEVVGLDALPERFLSQIESLINSCPNMAGSQAQVRTLVLLIGL